MEGVRMRRSFKRVTVPPHMKCKREVFQSPPQVPLACCLCSSHRSAHITQLCHSLCTSRGSQLRDSKRGSHAVLYAWGSYGPEESPPQGCLKALGAGNGRGWHMCREGGYI